MENSNHYIQQQAQERQHHSSTGNYQVTNSALQQNRLKNEHSQSHQYITDNQQNYLANKQVNNQQYVLQNDGPENKQGQYVTKHKPINSRMSVESPKFANHQNQPSQQQSSQQANRHSKSQMSMSGLNKAERTRKDEQVNPSSQQAQQNAQSRAQNGKHVQSSNEHHYQKQYKQSSGGQQQRQGNHKLQGNSGHVQSFSQSRYISSKNEKDIKQIAKIDLRNQLDETIEEEELQNQMLAVASINQSRSQSYAAASRREELATPRDDQSSGSEKENAPNGRNLPSSTHPQISGEELRQELFFVSRQGNSKSSCNEYFAYKEMVQMYQAEIKRRWDGRAQIKERYVFPRMQNSKKKDRQSQHVQQSPNPLKSKTPVLLARHNPKAGHDSTTPMDSNNFSKQVSLIPSEGKISPTKNKQLMQAQLLHKSMQGNDSNGLGKENQAQAMQQLIQQPDQNLSKAQLSYQQQQLQQLQHQMANKKKEKSVSPDIMKSSRVHFADHQHTQSAAVIGQSQPPADFNKIGAGYQGSGNIAGTTNGNGVQDSKRERRNQQQIQNMMKYNQGPATKTPIQNQTSMKGIAKQQIHQPSQSRNNNLSDLQKPQIMSMQPAQQNRLKQDSHMLSYGPTSTQQMASQKQITNLTSQTGKQLMHVGRPANQSASAINHSSQSQTRNNTTLHQQKSSVDQLKKHLQDHRGDPSQKKTPIIQTQTHYSKSFVNKNDAKKNSKQGRPGSRNNASIVSAKSSKSPAIQRPQRGSQIPNSKHRPQERTMTQQEGVMMASGQQSQKQTYRGQVKSDQIPEMLMKYKTKATINKNSIMTLNKFSDIQLDAADDQANQQLSSNRAVQRKNHQYQIYKVESQKSQMGSNSGNLTSGRGGAQSTDKVIQQSKQNMQQKMLHEQQTRMVSNYQKHHENDGGVSLVVTFQKPEQIPRVNHTVSPLKQKHKQSIPKQVAKQPLQPAEYPINYQKAINAGAMNSLTNQKSVVSGTENKSPIRNVTSKANVSIFDSSPESLSQFENSQQKKVAYQTSKAGQVEADQANQYRDSSSNIRQSVGSQRLYEQYRNHPDIAKYMSQDQVYQKQNIKGNSGIIQPEMNNSKSYFNPNEMSDVVEAWRESSENTFGQQDNTTLLNEMQSKPSSKSQTLHVFQRTQSSKNDGLENVAPEASQESIVLMNQLPEQHQDQPAPDNRKVIYQIYQDQKQRGPQIQQMVQKKTKNEPRVMQKSMGNHSQTRSMQAMERPLSSKSQKWNENQKKHNYPQQSKQMFNEYNDTIENLNQLKNQRQRSSGINNSISNFQTDSKISLKTHNTTKPNKTFSKSSSKQQAQSSQTQIMLQQQQALIDKLNGASITSAPQASRMIQKQQHLSQHSKPSVAQQLQSQSFSLNNMIGSRNMNQGLKNINTMKDQRVGGSQDQQMQGHNTVNTLQSQSTVKVPSTDVILNMQKQQIVAKVPTFKHQAQRSQNQQSVLFKPQNIIQSSSKQQQSRNPGLMHQQSSSMIYGSSQGQTTLLTSMSQPGPDNQIAMGQQSHQHFHSISSHQDLAQSSSNTQYRRQMMRDASQKSVSNTKNSQTSLITLNMGANNNLVHQYQQNNRTAAESLVYGGHGPGHHGGYSIQSQPKIPKKKRQTNSFSGSGTNSGAAQSNGPNVQNMNQINNYNDGTIKVPKSSINSVQNQQFQLMASGSNNHKHRQKNNSSVASANSMKQTYQGYVGYHAMQHPSLGNNSQSTKNLGQKIKANSVYGQNSSVSQMGVLRNAQMKPKK